MENWQWSAAGTEIKVPSIEKPELTNVLPLKSGVGQNIAMHASPTARNFFLTLISTFTGSAYGLFRAHTYHIELN